MSTEAETRQERVARVQAHLEAKYPSPDGEASKYIVYHTGTGVRVTPRQKDDRIDLRRGEG